jgi:perosamine synthetase
LKIPVSGPFLGGNEEKYVLAALRAGEVSSIGSNLKEFERRFAGFAGTRHATTMSNGTVALHAALQALDLRPGDEVIVPALTFVATAATVIHAGAKPVFVDVHPDHWGMDAREVAKKLSPRTRAIVPVHLYGHPADMDPVLKVAAERGVTVIEDAAEAHGATYKGRPVGSLARAGVFSFYGNKIITTGEGGMVTTDDEPFLQRIVQLKNHGMDPERRSTARGLRAFPSRSAKKRLGRPTSTGWSACWWTTIRRSARTPSATRSTARASRRGRSSTPSPRCRLTTRTRATRSPSAFPPAA